MRRSTPLSLAVAAAMTAALLAQTPHPSRGALARTPDGQPDLQGIWTNATLTPFERPPSLRDKPFLTEAEAAAIERQASERRDDDPAPRTGDVGSYNQFWFDSGERVVS